MTVGEFCEGFAIVDAATGFLPEFHWLNGGHEDFLSAGPVHFLPYDLYYLQEGFLSERQVHICAACDFSYEAGPNHELVACDFGVGGYLFYGRYQSLAISHSLCLVFRISCWCGLKLEIQYIVQKGNCCKIIIVREGAELKGGGKMVVAVWRYSDKIYGSDFFRIGFGFWSWVR